MCASRLPHVRLHSPRRHRRAAALLVTVLLGTLAATIAIVALTHALASTHTQSRQTDVASAQHQASQALVAYQVALARDWLTPLHVVYANASGTVTEQARVCTAQSSAVYQPGQAWPAACGSSWTYQPASTPGSTVLEVTPPTPTQPLLTVSAVATVNGVSAGATETLRQSGAGRFTIWSQRSLVLNQLVSGPSATSSLSGSIYTGGNLYLPTTAQVQISDAQLLTEQGFVGSLTDPSLFYDSTTPNPTSVPPVGNIRSVLPGVLNLHGIAGAADQIRTAACAPASALTSTGATTSLCLTAGATVMPTSGTAVTIPPAASGYLLLFGASGAPGTVDIYATTAQTSRYGPSVAGQCQIRCNLPQLTAPEASAGTSPGTSGYWTTNLGTFALPTTGVIATDRATYLGLCGTAFTTPGATCNTVSGTAPGMAIQQSVTVVAGTTGAPSNVYIDSPITSIGTARLGVLATGQVIFPYWARSQGTNMTVDAAITSLGLGATTDPAAVPSVQTLPTSSLPQIANNPNEGGQLTIQGSLVAPDLNFAVMQGFAGVSLLADPGLLAAPPPFLPGFTTTWRPIHNQAMSAAQVAAVG